MKDTVIIIPARMESTRLPGKPLLMINGHEMIVHVMKRAIAADCGDVYVACCEKEVFDVVVKNGGNAIMTDKNHPSGSDRIYEALCNIGGNYKYIINLQGDLPNVSTNVIRQTYLLLQNNKIDISTLVSAIKHKDEFDNPNVVKAVIAFDDDSFKKGNALYFTRARAPYGEGELYHHIGIYGYKKESLKKFVTLRPSYLEKREKLEQLRALENNMKIGVAVVEEVPLGVDTVDDLEKMRSIMKYEV